MGDISELGEIVAGAFEHPDEVGNGQYLPLVGDLMRFKAIVDTLNQQGHKFTFTRVPAVVYGTFFPGATEMAEMLGYFQAHTYLGASSADQIALANRIAGREPSTWSRWARQNFPVQGP